MSVINFTVLLTIITSIASLEYVGLRPFSIALVNLLLSVVTIFFKLCVRNDIHIKGMGLVTFIQKASLLVFITHFRGNA